MGQPRIFVDVRLGPGAQFSLDPDAAQHVGKALRLKTGDTITVFGWRARDGGNWAHSREITLAGGKKLFFGPPAGTGDGGTNPAVEVP